MTTQPTYIATPDHINGQSVAIIAATPLAQVKAILERSGLPKHTFKHGLTMTDARQRIMSIQKIRFSYYACIQQGDDNCMRVLDGLEDSDLIRIVKELGKF